MAQKFVCVRIQSMNGVDLNHFQFEFDLTWMSFFQNAAGRTYTRYGGRDDRSSESFLNKASLINTMREVLKLHAKDATQPTSKFEPQSDKVFKPEQISTMAKMFKERKSNCIHCHDVKVAQLKQKRQAGTLAKEMVFTYPIPSQIGIEIDPKIQNVVAKVIRDSAASKAGIQKGDRLISSNQQRLLTIADLTRVLELTDDVDQLPLKVDRDGVQLEKTLSLQSGWRKSADPSWRESMHVVGPGGGFWGRVATAAERKKFLIPAKTMALKVTFVWAPHAKQAGIRVGDIIVEVDQSQRPKNIHQFHSHLQMNRDWGDRVPLTIRRGNKTIELELKLPQMPKD